MLVCDDQIRLTLQERRQVRALTGEDPINIRTRAQLEGFIAHHRRRLRRLGGRGGCLAQRLLADLLISAADSERKPDRQEAVF